MKKQSNMLKIIIIFTFSIIGLPFLIFGLYAMFFLRKNDPSLGPLSLVFTVLGGVFLFVGVTVMIATFKSNKNRKRIIASGNYVIGIVSDIYPNRNVQINGQNPWVIEVTHTDSAGQNHVFVSDMYKNNPAEFITTDEIVVWIDVNDLRNYYVDLETAAGEHK